MFKKAKPTFLSQAGRLGAPMARKPMAKKKTISSKSKPAGKSLTGTKVIKNGHPAKTSKVKPNVNAKTGKAGKFSLSGKPSVDQRLSNYFMSHSKPLTSATNSPQTAPQSFRPRG